MGKKWPCLNNTTVKILSDVERLNYLRKIPCFVQRKFSKTPTGVDFDDELSTFITLGIKLAFMFLKF